MSVFVRGGQDLRVKAPLGRFVIKYAYGSTWHGYKELFGPATQFAKAEDIFSFTSDDAVVEGYVITLYKVANGNLQTETISKGDF